MESNPFRQSLANKESQKEESRGRGSIWGRLNFNMPSSFTYFSEYHI